MNVYPELENDRFPIRLVGEVCGEKIDQGITLADAVRIRNEMTTAIEVYLSSRMIRAEQKSRTSIKGDDHEK